MTTTSVRANRNPRLKGLRRWFDAIDAALDYQPTDRLGTTVRDLERRIADLEAGRQSAELPPSRGGNQQI